MAQPRPAAIPLHAAPALGRWIVAAARALALPVLLLRANGVLWKANPAGAAALRRARTLALRGPRVVAADPAHEPAWLAACARAAQTRRAVRWAPHGGPPVSIAPVACGDGSVLLWIRLPDAGSVVAPAARGPRQARRMRVAAR